MRLVSAAARLETTGGHGEVAHLGRGVLSLPNEYYYEWLQLYFLTQRMATRYAVPRVKTVVEASVMPSKKAIPALRVVEPRYTNSTQTRLNGVHACTGAVVYAMLRRPTEVRFDGLEPRQNCVGCSPRLPTVAVEGDETQREGIGGS